MNDLWSKVMCTLSASSRNHTEDLDSQGWLRYLQARPGDACYAWGTPIKCIKVKAVMGPKSRLFCFILGFLIFSGRVVLTHSESQSLLIVWHVFCLLSTNESIKQRNTSVWRPFKSQLVLISKEFQKNLIFLLNIYFFNLFNAKPCWIM